MIYCIKEDKDLYGCAHSSGNCLSCVRKMMEAKEHEQDKFTDDRIHIIAERLFKLEKNDDRISRLAERISVLEKELTFPTPSDSVAREQLDPIVAENDCVLKDYDKPPIASEVDDIMYIIERCCTPMLHGAKQMIRNQVIKSMKPKLLDGMFIEREREQLVNIMTDDMMYIVERCCTPMLHGAKQMIRNQVIKSLERSSEHYASYNPRFKHKPIDERFIETERNAIVTNFIMNNLNIEQRDRLRKSLQDAMTRVAEHHR